MDRLRLFPLHTVLFPRMEIRLQVFEPRYRALVAECLDSGETFGVVLIRDGDEVGESVVPHRFGCTARIRRVAPTRDGRLSLVAAGERRFRIRRLYHDQPYLSAEVEYPVDEVAEVSPGAFEEARERLRQLLRLRDTIAGEFHQEIATPGTPGMLADRVGELGRGLVSDRRLQRLLSTLNVHRRFEIADELLTALVAATHEQAAAVVAQRWGRVERRN